MACKQVQSPGKYWCNSGDTKPIFFLIFQMLSPVPRFLSNKIILFAYACGLSPFTRLSKVDLPAPFGPDSDHRSPCLTSQLISSRIYLSSYLIFTPCILTM